MKQKIKEKEMVEENLIHFSQKKQEKILEEYQVTKKGLTQKEAEERLEKYGKNSIDINQQNQLWKRIKEALINPFTVVLMVIAIITYATDVVFAEEPSYATFVMLVFIVFLSGGISYIQTEKSNQAARKLQKMIANSIDVIRDGENQVISLEDAVPGDIVQLASGDMIPGDVRFLETKDVFIDQSQLTGESNPIEKFTENKNHNTEISELTNIGFMGSNIISGVAKAIILTTGNKTYFGSMAKSLSTEKSKSSFEQNIDSISHLLIKLIIFVIPIILVVNIITKNNWLESLMFAITIAVGLLPEMLPVIMTSTLAKGAIGMAKKKTIVKRLGAIQTLGEMDILCTDKTGTLTEDKIALEKYMDPRGNEDKRILKHAFLTSYFQTGLKNAMDIAITNRAKQENLDHLINDYEREDEIPFDFTRRRMSVVLVDKTGKRQLITKGAVEEILSICSVIEIDGQVKPLGEQLKEEVKKVYEKNNEQGIRMIAVAQKNQITENNSFKVEDENSMVFIGFIGFLDPPKKSAELAISALKKHGVKTVVLTGDSQGVALTVCRQLQIDTTNLLTGSQIETMSDETLKQVCEKCHVFCKLTPFQKKRVVTMFQENGHTVGFMGDGINDSPPLKQSDVGISVDTAVDIAKEVADIILLEKDLTVLEEGVIEGRKTFANMTKYLKMAISGNFGNMFSIVIASIVLPFLPLKPIHILIQNILNDFAQLGMPFDHVEKEYIDKPKKWEIKAIKNFMIYFGFLSTIIDVLCFILLWFVFGYHSIEQADLFQCGWFILGIVSQTLVIHTIRTHKIPFIQGKSSKQLTISTISIIVVTLVIGFTPLAEIFDLKAMPLTYLFWLSGLMALYLGLAQWVKRIYMKINHEWI